MLVLNFVPRWVLVWWAPLLVAVTIIVGLLLTAVGVSPSGVIAVIGLTLCVAAPLALICFRHFRGLERPEDGMPAGRLDSWITKRR